MVSHPDDEPDRVDLRHHADLHGENPRLCFVHEPALDGVKLARNAEGRGLRLRGTELIAKLLQGVQFKN